jgi:hypothetical protein
MFNLGRYALRDVMNMQAFYLENSTPLIYWPYANTSNMSLNADAVYATGGSGAPRRVSFFGSKTGTVTFETQMFSAGILAILFGTEVVEEATSNIFKVYNGKVVDNAGELTVTLPKTPVPDVFPSAFKFVNGVIVSPVAINTINGAELVLDPDDVQAGDEVQVFYQAATVNKAYRIPIEVDKYPPYLKIVGDTFFADELTGKMVDAQFVFYKARALPTAELAMANSGDPTSLSIQMDLFGFDVEGKSKLFDIVLHGD